MFRDLISSGDEVSGVEFIENHLIPQVITNGKH